MKLFLKHSWTIKYYRYHRLLLALKSQLSIEDEDELFRNEDELSVLISCSS